MPPYRPYTPPAAKPSREICGSWNASSTGHQRGENRVGKPTSWRNSRTKKLQGQYLGKAGNVRDEEKTERRQKTVLEMLVQQHTTRKSADGEDSGSQHDNERTESYLGSLGSSKPATIPMPPQPSSFPSTLPAEPASGPPQDITSTARQPPHPKKIFTNLIIYINGSTMPHVSDHRLKQLLATHGARVAIALGRRSVTHVILGTPNAGPCVGTGGGLAGGKVQGEILRIGGCGVRYVGVEWVLDSIKAGKRLQEAAYSPMLLASRRQKNVYRAYAVMKKGAVVAEKTDPKDGTKDDSANDNQSSGSASASVSSVSTTIKSCNRENKRPCFFSI